MSRPTVALAVSGHGFGHAVRSAQVATALLDLGVRVVIRTDAPRWLFPPGVEHLPSAGGALDVGVVQHDGLDVDIEATRLQWLAFGAAFSSGAETEARLLRASGVDVLLGDVPPLAFAAAHLAGVRSLAVTNFGWDWIYGAWADFERPIEIIQAAYRQADGLLRLPLHSRTPDAFAAFKQIVDVPLIARRAPTPRSLVRRRLGLADSATVVLLSFGGFTAHGLDLAALGRWRDYVFVVTPPLSTALAEPAPNVVALSETPDDYVSLVAASDVIVTKPGYGIVADCLAHRVALLFTDRGPFREYDVLAEALPGLGPARYVPRHDLLAGRLGPHLDRLLSRPTAWTPQRLDGAQVVARAACALHSGSAVQGGRTR